MPDNIQVGDRVKVLLQSRFWNSEGWHNGVVVRVDPYSRHRNFYWVELDEAIEASFGTGTKLISVLNPKNIEKIE